MRLDRRSKLPPEEPLATEPPERSLSSELEAKLDPPPAPPSSPTMSCLCFEGTGVPRRPVEGFEDGFADRFEDFEEGGFQFSVLSCSSGL